VPLSTQSSYPHTASQVASSALGSWGVVATNESGPRYVSQNHQEPFFGRALFLLFSMAWATASETVADISIRRCALS
jgi:hypothetical protein